MRLQILLVLLNATHDPQQPARGSCDRTGKARQPSFWILLMTALATNISALAVGVGLFVVSISLAAGAIEHSHHDHKYLGCQAGRSAVTTTRAGGRRWY